MLPRLLEFVHEALENRAEYLERLLMLWTVMVVLGLMYEYAPEFTRVPTRWTPRHPKIFKWIRILELTGAALVTIGVAGELYIAVKAADVQGKLRALNDSRLADLNKQAAIARKEASNADERASASEKEAALLRKLAEGRQLTKAQIRKIGGSLKRFAGRNLFITSYTGDAEAARLGLQIITALGSGQANINADNNLGRTIAERGGVQFGISVSGPQDDMEFISAIAESLRTNGALGSQKPRDRTDNAYRYRRSRPHGRT